MRRRIDLTMKSLRIFTVLVAALLAVSEVGRWWGNLRFLPLAFDELLVAAAMAWSAFAARRIGAAPLAAAWGLFSGLALSLLIPTLDHLLHGPAKKSAVFYSVILALMLALGLWATWRALRLCREPRCER